MAEALNLPEVKITGKRPAVAGAKKTDPDTVGIEVSRMGVLGQKGMSDADRAAIARMLKTLETIE